MAKLFSIKKEFVDKIYDKEKLVELRRQNVNIKPGEKCFIYTTSPEKKVSGYFIVRKKIRTNVNKLWELTKNISGVSKKIFFEYFKDCRFGTAILFEKVQKLKQEISLEEIRMKMGKFNPPQSYYNIDTLLLDLFNGLNSQNKLNKYINS